MADQKVETWFYHEASIEDVGAAFNRDSTEIVFCPAETFEGQMILRLSRHPEKPAFPSILAQKLSDPDTLAVRVVVSIVSKSKEN